MRSGHLDNGHLSNMKTTNEILNNAVVNLWQSSIHSDSWQFAKDVTLEDGDEVFTLACEYVRVIHELGNIKEFMKMCDRHDQLDSYSK